MPSSPRFLPLALPICGSVSLPRKNFVTLRRRLSPGSSMRRKRKPRTVRIWEVCTDLRGVVRFRFTDSLAAFRFAATNVCQGQEAQAILAEVPLAAAERYGVAP